MKSFLIWLIATFFGTALGYGLNWLTGLNIYLCLGIGAVIGSSAGITVNIHREREVNESEPEIKTEKSDAEPNQPEENGISSDNANQKAS